MITENTISIEGKGKDVYPVKNNLNIIIASNNDWVVPAGKEERRFAVLEVKEDVLKNHEYFKEIGDQMDNGGCEALRYFLENYDISKFNLRKIPQTDALFQQKLHSRNALDKWWYDALLDEGFYMLSKGLYQDITYQPWKEAFDTDELFDSYLHASKKFNTKNYLSKAGFGTDLKKICPKVLKKRIRKCGLHQYLLPPLEVCRKDFEIAFEMENKINWLADEEDERDLHEIVDEEMPNM